VNVDIVEILERVRNRFAVKAERSRKFSLVESPDWRERLHVALGADGCQCHEFQGVWEAVVASLEPTTHEPGRGYDAGVTLAEAVFLIVRHARPEYVVETGVARGVTSRVILEAMEMNGVGQLLSIDLPPRNRAWRDEAGVAVNDSLRHRWIFVRGSSRQKLDGVLRLTPGLPLFVHDSMHTYRNMTWEYQRAWAILRPGGILVSDDVEDNPAFVDFAARRDDLRGDPIIVKEEHRSGYIGLIQKAL
jgi:hypothetical protein